MGVIALTDYNETAPNYYVNGPVGVAFTPNGSKALIANEIDHTVSVIATATNTVVATIDVGTAPIAFGVFIVPSLSRLPSKNYSSKPQR
jgi:YVTN family beta-propeller protein